VCAGATDPSAVASLEATLKGSKVVHLPRLHAKVYAADGRTAVVTSGNLTAGGLGRNYEYGVVISDAMLARSIETDILEYAALGAEIDTTTLAKYCEAAIDARVAYEQQVTSASRAVQRRLASALHVADDTLIRARLAGGAMHSVFSRTISFLLRRQGPLTTQQLHPLVQQLHPDLCDDVVDRVIDGKRFGKKWKHAVRTAQQQLKKAGLIALVDGRWHLVGD
jgi:phosphatidylserine/phosphatidylglycerophosphate/cardiolipin synthase-like enzyme